MPVIRFSTQPTEELSFYHGTSATAARAILKDGARDALGEIGARDLGIEIWQALLKSGDGASFNALFGQVGIDEQLCVAALRQIVNPEAISRYEYRHFYATLNQAHGYRYAIGNPYRSELLRALAEGLMVLSRLGDPLPKTFSSRYPGVERALCDTSGPVALELKGIRYKRLVADNGSSRKSVDDELGMWNQMKSGSGKSYRLAFRIKKVRPSDIVAVHDLRDWRGNVPLAPWLIPESFITKARMSPESWLSATFA